MHENPQIFLIITRYFSGEIDENELALLNDWLKTPENRREFKAFARANFLATAEPAVDPMKRQPHIMPWKRNLLRIAAVLLLLLTVGFFWKSVFPVQTVPFPDEISVAVDGVYQKIDPVKMQGVAVMKDNQSLALLVNGDLKIKSGKKPYSLSINVPNGKTLKVHLQDGTEVIMNSATQLDLNSSLVQGEARSVKLSGEAFFNVAHNAAHPFIVKTQKFTTKVLGTKFNISSYANENAASVSLVEGKIEVSGTQTAARNILLPGEKIRFTAETVQPRLEAAMPRRDMDWLNKEIAFDNNTTDEVLNKIERVYGLQIVRSRTQNDSFHFSGTFKIENLDQITHSLELLLDCKIRRDGTKLIILPTK